MSADYERLEYLRVLRDYSVVEISDPQNVLMSVEDLQPNQAEEPKMSDRGYNTWMYRIGFVFLGLALIVLRLLPLQTIPQTWAGPDVMLCLVFAWSVRRPDYVPTLLIAAVILLEIFYYNVRRSARSTDCGGKFLVKIQGAHSRRPNNDG